MIRKIAYTDIQRLIWLFENQQLARTEWNHEAHLIAAVWYVNRHNMSVANEMVKGFIIRHNQSVGTPNSDKEGYHETLTRFWLWTVARFLDGKRQKSIEEQCQEIVKSSIASRDYPLQYYSQDLLWSVKARRQWVRPDLEGLTLSIAS